MDGCFGCKFVRPHFSYRGARMIVSCKKLDLAGIDERDECEAHESKVYGKFTQEATGNVLEKANAELD